MILDGMHPLVKQIPPGSSFSMTAIRILGFSWIIASTMFIAEPEPMMIRSYSFIAGPTSYRPSEEKHFPGPTFAVACQATVQPRFHRTVRPESVLQETENRVETSKPAF